MNKHKGFTLIEMMTVVIIIGILAMLSIPNIIGYARDARNDRAKTTLYTIAQGYKNFRNDFPWVNIGTLGPLASQAAGATETSCDDFMNNIVNNNNPNANFDSLIKCSYIDNINYERLRYNFYLGNGGNACAACLHQMSANSRPVEPILACMIGTDSGQYGGNYCAVIDSENNLLEISNLGN